MLLLTSIQYAPMKAFPRPVICMGCYRHTIQDHATGTSGSLLTVQLGFGECTSVSLDAACTYHKLSTDGVVCCACWVCGHEARPAIAPELLLAINTRCVPQPW
jgi:hypothetical protein